MLPCKPGRWIIYLPDKQAGVLLDDESAARVQGGCACILDRLGHQVPGRRRALWRDAVQRPAPARLGTLSLPGQQLQPNEYLMNLRPEHQLMFCTLQPSGRSMSQTAYK